MSGGDRPVQARRRTRKRQLGNREPGGGVWSCKEWSVKCCRGCGNDKNPGESPGSGSSELGVILLRVKVQAAVVEDEERRRLLQDMC